MIVSRRALVTGALAAAAAGAMSRVKGAGHSATPARRFFESVGVNTHPNWRGSLWGRSDWGGAVLRLGTRNIRGKIGSGQAGAAALAKLRPLFARGVKICVPVAEPDGVDFDLAATRDALEFLMRQVGPANVSGIESANEYNSPSRRPPDWASRIRSLQQWLHATVRAERAFDHVPLIAPSIWGRIAADYHALGDLSPYVDRTCLHYYTGGRRPDRVGITSGHAGEDGGLGETSLSVAIGDARRVAPGKPLWVTEFGYPIAGVGAAHARNVSEAVAAKYLLRGLFDMFSAGAEKTFVYTLIDDVHRSPPRYHGLMSGNMVPRPAYRALANLMALFRDDRPGSSAALLDYSLVGAGGDVVRQLFAKSDGTMLLVLYRNVDSHDRWRGRDISVRPDPVRLDLHRRAARIDIYRPSLAAAPSRSVRQAASIEIPVYDDVSVVRITP